MAAYPEVSLESCHPALQIGHIGTPRPGLPIQGLLGSFQLAPQELDLPQKAVRLTLWEHQSLSISCCLLPMFTDGWEDVG